MKKLYALLCIVICSTVVLNAQSKWNVGVETGCVTNIAKFDSGDETANALFNSSPHHSIRLAVNFRYKISEKFSIQTGLDFTEFGFDYGLSKDYSLLKPFERSDDISAATCISSIPVMAIINTPINCTNKRFIFGLGVVARGIDQSWESTKIDEISIDESGNNEVTYMTANTGTTSTLSGAVTWMIGMEKMLKSGNSLTFTYKGTQGLGTIAKSTVNYTVNDQNYEHTFINRGSFVSFSIGYNFMPFGTHKARKLEAAKNLN